MREAASGPTEAPAVFDRPQSWVVVAIVMVVVACGPTFFSLVTATPMNVPGFGVR